MARKKKSGPLSQKTTVVKCQRVASIIDFMMASWSAKVTLVLGLKEAGAGFSASVKGLRGVVLNPLQSYKAKDGAVKNGVPKSEDEYADPWSGKLPVWTGGISASDGVEELKVIPGVMTKANAIRAIKSAANQALVAFDATTGVQEGVRTYRKFIAGAASHRIMAWEEKEAIERYLPMALMGKNRRAGRQRVSTTRRNKVPESGRFVFGGRKAVRMPQGRPALPLDTWLARYNARKSRRQQRNVTAIRRNRGVVKVPVTRYSRPDVVELLGG